MSRPGREDSASPGSASSSGSSLGLPGYVDVMRRATGEGFDYEFCPTADERFICPVCMLVMRRAVQTTCGHRFCDTCIRHWIRYNACYLRQAGYLLPGVCLFARLSVCLSVCLLAILRKSYCSGLPIQRGNPDITYGLFRRQLIPPFRQARTIGGASAVKEPGHFEVSKSSSQVTRIHFLLKKVDDLFSVVAVRYGNIFVFCSHYYRIKAIRRARQGGARAWARAVDLPARAFDLAPPGVAPPLARTRRSVIDMPRLRKMLTYLLTYLWISRDAVKEELITCWKSSDSKWTCSLFDRFCPFSTSLI